MVDPGFWSELFVRAGLTGTLAVVAIVLLDADPWIWRSGRGGPLVTVKCILEPTAALTVATTVAVATTLTPERPGDSLVHPSLIGRDASFDRAGTVAGAQERAGTQQRTIVFLSLWPYPLLESPSTCTSRPDAYPNPRRRPGPGGTALSMYGFGRPSCGCRWGSPRTGWAGAGLIATLGLAPWAPTWWARPGRSRGSSWGGPSSGWPRPPGYRWWWPLAASSRRRRPCAPAPS